MPSSGHAGHQRAHKAAFIAAAAHAGQVGLCGRTGWLFGTLGCAVLADAAIGCKGAEDPYVVLKFHFRRVVR